MKYNFDVYGLHRASTEHSAQDKFLVHKFQHQGKEICVGVLSDGCSGDVKDFHYRPELGAKWLTKEFAKQAELFYKQGKRKDILGGKIVLAILNGMRAYQPQHQNSKQDKGPWGQCCDELTGTLYGFVADEESIMWITSGDGFVFQDEKVQYIPDSGDYPCHMLGHVPEDQWEKKLDSLFRINSIDTNKLSLFGIASDGLEHREKGMAKVLKTTNRDPKKIAWGLADLPEISENHDDISVIILTVNQN